MGAGEQRAAPAREHQQRGDARDDEEQHELAAADGALPG